ncbi:transglycosylase SLT domain-containing protein [Roseicella frigidaeris]|uniref:transglycosylase SLT domain-containing protein n=1 Tax=Roseicella frigidaeris TaxID=2230885 RepID=UPI00140334C6|nr:transglycosylase SLT domain-containing protein [Roseicella frigidaeris]
MPSAERAATNDHHPANLGKGPRAMTEMIGYDPEGEAIRRRRAQADALLAQSMSGQGNFTHRNSWLGPVAQALAGAFLQVQAGRDTDALAKDRQEGSTAFDAKFGLTGGGSASPDTGMSLPAASAPPSMTMPAAAPPPSDPNPQPMPAATPAQTPPQFAPAVQTAAQRNSIPPQLLAGILSRESGWNPNARGGAGEVGLGQILPSTARNPGFGMQGVDPATLNDPTANINFAADYFGARARAKGLDLSNPSHQDLALRAYNGGGDPNYVQNVRAKMAPIADALMAGAGGATTAPAPAAPAGPDRFAQAFANAPMLTDAAGLPDRGRMALAQQLLPPERRAAVQQASAGPDYRRAAIEAANSPNPLIRQKASLLAQLATTQGRDEGLQLQRDRFDWERQRAGQVDARTAAQRDEDWRRKLAELEIQQRFQATRDMANQPLVPTQGPNGPLLTPRSEAAGQAPYQEPPRPMQVSPGSTVIDPKTGQPIYQAPPAPSQNMPPSTMVGGMLENANAIRKIDQALSQLGTPQGQNAVGLGNAVMPDFLVNRTDPQGTSTRALIADIGSLKIHDRSGAAVSASEEPRLRPFIPKVSDSPETIRAKLGNFRQEYMSLLQDQYSIYGPQGGGKALPAIESVLTPRQREQQQPQGPAAPGGNLQGFSIRRIN